jgi:hypothetical protein
MKAISLWEPWASFMAMGAKKKSPPPAELLHWLRRYKQEFGVYGSTGYDVFDALPFGHAVCVVEVYDCVETDAYAAGDVFASASYLEACLGDYSVGRFVWRTRNLRRFDKPFPVKGSQGFFDVPDELVREALNGR